MTSLINNKTPFLVIGKQVYRKVVAAENSDKLVHSKKPKGWDKESFESAWKKMGSDFDKCVKKAKGDFKDPEGYCAYLEDQATGSTAWRGGKRRGCTMDDSSRKGSLLYRQADLDREDEILSILGVPDLDPTTLAHWFASYIDPGAAATGKDDPEKLAQIGIDSFGDDPEWKDVNKRDLFEALLRAATAYVDMLQKEEEDNSNESESDHSEAATYRRSSLSRQEIAQQNENDNSDDDYNNEYEERDLLSEENDLPDEEDDLPPEEDVFSFDVSQLDDDVVEELKKLGNGEEEFSIVVDQVPSDTIQEDLISIENTINDASLLTTVAGEYVVEAEGEEILVIFQANMDETDRLIEEFVIEKSEKE